MKSIDLKLKLLDNQQKDADSWILAKQPLGCFNCASCEANIKNVSTSNDYVPWNKYPQGERQYHIGQGFSRLLQKIGNESMKNISDNKEIVSDNDITKTNYANSMVNVKNSNNFFFKINNRETIKEALIDNLPKFIKKNKLPNLKNKRKQNENIPLTDEENDLKNNSMDNSNNSPKIMKITKKSLQGKFSIFNSNPNTLNIENKPKMNSTSVQSKFKFDRNKSLPLYDNP